MWGTVVSLKRGGRGRDTSVVVRVGWKRISTLHSNLGPIILSEVSQKEENNDSMLTHIYGI